MTILFEDGSDVKLVRKLRTAVAVFVARAISKLITHFGIGQGGTLPGRVLLALEPNALSVLSQGVISVVVSGTNGKTTTTAMISDLLSRYEIYTNDTGANMDFGVAFALARAQRVPGSHQLRFGVFEVDEAYLPAVAATVNPKVVVLLNLSRDQLDRNSEVRMIAKRWRDLFGKQSKLKVVANCDDPLVVYAAMGSSDPIYVSSGGGWHLDATSCPICESKVIFSDCDWGCSVCDFRRPNPSYSLDQGGGVVRDHESLGELNLLIPGRFNLGNALLAIAATSELARLSGVPFNPEEALRRLQSFEGSGGRYSIYSLGRPDGVKVRTMLAKNPAGWNALIDTVLEDPIADGLVMALNANVADGKDTSWIWDVHFERLSNRYKRIVVLGDRKFDLAVRLGYADIDPMPVSGSQLDALQNLECSPNTTISYIGNYTAFYDLRKDLLR